MNKTPITSRPRRWRRPVPCPVCGGRRIRFRKAGLTLNLVTLHVVQVWAAYCAENYCGIWLYTNHAGLKAAIRLWNRAASDHTNVKEI
ncbi:MAG: hypothetical protein ACFNZP_00340 [Bifidobacterium dentium]